MPSHSTIPDEPQSETETAVPLFDNWFDPIEAGLRDRARDFLQAMLEGELDEVLDRARYARRAKGSSGDSEDRVSNSPTMPPVPGSELREEMWSKPKENPNVRVSHAHIVP